MKTGKASRRDHEIRRNINLLLRNARPGLANVHLTALDWARVSRDPGYFNVTKTPDDRLVIVYDSRLVDVVTVNG